MQKLLQHLLIIVKSSTFLIIFLVLIGVLTISYKAHSNILLAGSGNRFMEIDKAIYNNLSFYQNSNFKFTPATIPVQVVTPPNISLSGAVINPIPTIPSKPISAPKSTPKQSTKNKKETVKSIVKKKNISDPLQSQGPVKKIEPRAHVKLTPPPNSPLYYCHGDINYLNDTGEGFVKKPVDNIIPFGSKYIQLRVETIYEIKNIDWNGEGKLSDLYGSSSKIGKRWDADTPGLYYVYATVTSTKEESCKVTFKIDLKDTSLPL